MSMLCQRNCHKGKLTRPSPIDWSHHLKRLMIKVITILVLLSSVIGFSLHYEFNILIIYKKKVIYIKIRDSSSETSVVDTCDFVNL